MAAEDAFRATSRTPQTAPIMRSLAELAPRTLALMHGSSYEGDGAAAARAGRRPCRPIPGRGGGGGLRTQRRGAGAFRISMLPLLSVRLSAHPPAPMRPLRESAPREPVAVTGSSLRMEPKEVRAVTS